jgi:hypothetical protein
LIGPCVLVLTSPNAVFVLRDAGDLFRLNASVTTAAGAASGTVIFADRRNLANPGDFEGEAHHRTPRRIRRFTHVSLGVRKDSAAFWRIGLLIPNSIRPNQWTV